MKPKIIIISASSLAFSASSLVYAQDAATPIEPVPKTATDDKLQKSNTKNFAGLDFGVGVSATFDLGSNDRITTAEIVNGLVRVTDKDNVRARIMLESHYFFKPSFKFLKTDEENWGYGPFIALQPGTDEIIESIGAGLMFGFRRNSSSEEDANQSFNIGFGVAFDPNTQTLGEGIVNGEPLPEGETAVRFLEQDQVGLLILTSFSF